MPCTFHIQKLILPSYMADDRKWLVQFMKSMAVMFWEESGCYPGYTAFLLYKKSLPAGLVGMAL